MASKKKASEGIALLSMYNDEDDDMDDAYDHDHDHDHDHDPDNHHGQELAEQGDRQQQQHGAPILGRDDDSFDIDPSSSALDSSRDDTLPPKPDDSAPASVKFGTLTPMQQSQPQPHSPPVEELQKNRRTKLTIVDYGHDEAAMSPEPEEGGGLESTSEMMSDGELHIANGDFQGKSPSGAVQVLSQGVQATSLFSEQVDLLHSDTSALNNSVIEIEVVEMEEAVKGSIEAGKDADLLEKFLPPPPKAKCSDELQEKIKRFLKYKKEGKSFNAEVRSRKDYRNPDFLLHAVRYQDIDEIGTCFSKDVFDPHGYDKSDYYVEIEADMKREMERREQEKKRSQKVDFVAGGTQPGSASAANKINLPIPGVSTVVTSGLIPVPNAVDAVSRDCRQNKKSKWDKVDGDRRNPLPPSGGQDSTSNAHATLLTVANAGAGYTAFAQQRRREAEEKRSGERKLERRS